MAGYVIADVEVTNPELFGEYRKLVAQTVEAYGGRYLARGGETELVEGERAPGRTVIIEFDSVERAREWHRSPEYEPVKRMRLDSANTTLIIAEGV